MQAQNQPKQNKWLTIGVTPPHIFQEAATLSQKLDMSWKFKQGAKRDLVAMATWLAETFPDGFTYYDIIPIKGKDTRYWSQYMWELKLYVPSILTVVGTKSTGVKTGRASIYRVNASRIKQLEAELEFKKLNRKDWNSKQVQE